MLTSVPILALDTRSGCPCPHIWEVEIADLGYIRKGEFIYLVRTANPDITEQYL